MSFSIAIIFNKAVLNLEKHFKTQVARGICNVPRNLGLRILPPCSPACRKSRRNGAERGDWESPLLHLIPTKSQSIFFDSATPLIRRNMAME
ncbi:hypothetical protein SK128_021292 [Halocaridina rubra]|uniref:Uncharacterized protein n=1 Tax=Halocaridina rubra TaxID=373956 RepID=A0AAN8WJQ4_HALRR